MRKRFFLSILSLFSFAVYSSSQPSPIKITQSNIKSKSRYIEKGRYDWKIYINADLAILKTISYVEYTLHPTYPKPVNRRTNYRNKFLYQDNGWGEFYISVRIVYKNHSSAVFKHFLTLKDDKDFPLLN